MPVDARRDAKQCEFVDAAMCYDPNLTVIPDSPAPEALAPARKAVADLPTAPKAPKGSKAYIEVTEELPAALKEYRKGLLKAKPDLRMAHPTTSASGRARRYVRTVLRDHQEHAMPYPQNLTAFYAPLRGTSPRSSSTVPAF